MDRRKFLAGTSLSLATTIAGCLENTPIGIGEQTYDECSLSIIEIDQLPEPARKEVTTALSDGVYESNGSLVLEDVMDTDAAYLRREEEHYRYYEPVIETEDGTTTLRLTEAYPETNENLTVVNRADKQRTITLRLVLNDETVFTDEFELDPFESDSYSYMVTVSDEVDWRLGVYRVEVETETLSAETDWEVESLGAGYYLDVDNDEISIGGPEDAVERNRCRWDSDGNVETRW